MFRLPACLSTVFGCLDCLSTCLECLYGLFRQPKLRQSDQSYQPECLDFLPVGLQCRLPGFVRHACLECLPCVVQCVSLHTICPFGLSACLFRLPGFLDGLSRSLDHLWLPARNTLKVLCRSAILHLWWHLWRWKCMHMLLKAFRMLVWNFIMSVKNYSDMKSKDDSYTDRCAQGRAMKCCSIFNARKYFV